MACLPSVETIATETLSLRHLRAYAPPKGGDTAPRIVFAALKTLKLDSFIPSQEEPARLDDVRGSISKYVTGRIARGQAILVVDLTEIDFDVLPDMVFLRKADGVKVLWRQRGVPGVQEYICGKDAQHKFMED